MSLSVPANLEHSLSHEDWRSFLSLNQQIETSLSDLEITRVTQIKAWIFQHTKDTTALRGLNKDREGSICLRLYHQCEHLIKKWPLEKQKELTTSLFLNITQLS